MKINSLKISGFKSIDEIELNDIPSFMVLAGANGSGKSNFVDALAFLGEVIRTNLNHAVEQFNGMDFICNKNRLKRDDKDISFYIEGKIEKGLPFTYWIQLNVDEQDSRISNEKIKINGEEYSRKSSNDLALWLKAQDELSKISEDMYQIYQKVVEQKIDSPKFSKEWVDINEQFHVKRELLNKIEKSIVSSRYADSDSISILPTIVEVKPLVDFLSNIQVFRIDPVQAKTPSLQGSTSKLLPNGSNIADILEKHQSDPEFREELMEWLEMIVPNLSLVQAEKRQIDTSSVLRFREGEHTFPAGLISDGTIYTLCILTAILSRSPQHGITIIEEPERGIHPQAIGELIALMREKVQDKHNIILTTHSEAVVRNLELEELYLVRKKDGQTLIKDVKNSKVDKNKIPLDTAWLSNLFGGGLPW